MEHTRDWHLTNVSARYNHIYKRFLAPYPSSHIFVINFGSVTTQWKIELGQNNGTARWRFYLRLLRMDTNAENPVPAKKLKLQKSSETVAQVKVQCQLVIIAPSDQKQNEQDHVYNQIGSMQFSLGPEIAADGKVVDDACPWVRGWQTVGCEELLKWVDSSNNTLHVRVNFTCGASGASTPSIPFTPERLAANLVSDLGGILASGENSDLLIRCGLSDSFFEVHKLVLSMRSQVFKTMLNSAMIEFSSGVITIEDINPLVMKLFLDFLYTAKIELSGLENDQVIGLIAAGDKYQVVGLKEICFQHLVTNMNEAACGKLAVAAYLHGAEAWQKDLIYEYVAERWKTLGTQDDFKELVRAYPDAFLKG